MKPWEERPADLDPRWLLFAATTVVLAAVFAPAERPPPSNGAPVVRAEHVHRAGQAGLSAGR